MSSPVTNPEMIVNLALTRIGWTIPIENLYEGSRAATAALNIYSQTRDELLRTQDWNFAYRSADLILLKQAPAGGYIPPNLWSPAFPPLPYLFEYDYPPDALRIRALKPADVFLPNYDPRPYVFSIYNDAAYNPSRKVILCNVENAVATYVGQITDPQQMEADFIEVLADALARRLAPGLTGLDHAKMAEEQEFKSNAEADSVQG